eukprot:g8322.t1
MDSRPYTHVQTQQYSSYDFDHFHIGATPTPGYIGQRVQSPPSRTTGFVVPIASSTGRPCRLCAAAMAYCHWHNPRETQYHQQRNQQRGFVAPIARSTGQPCKLCVCFGHLCQWHGGYGGVNYY